MLLDRRTFLTGMAAGAAALSLPSWARAARGPAIPDLRRVHAQVDKDLPAAIGRIQEWIRQPSISAEGTGIQACCDLTMRLLRDAGFQRATKIRTDGHPAVLATLDAGARRTLGVYFMYDVQPVIPSEWKSPPFAAKLVELPDVGKVIMGRGAVNQKGPQAAFLAALHAIRAAGQKVPVNVVVLAEGEEELGSPHLPQVVGRRDVRAALRRAQGLIMPSASQSLDGSVVLSLGNKGIVYLEIEASGARWGRGPRERDIHSSLKVIVDSPTWRLVQALETMVSPDGNDPAIDGLTDRVRKLSAEEERLLDEVARRWDDSSWKKSFTVDRWVGDLNKRALIERYVSRPSLNIDGLVAGYTGPGTKTILPARALAKVDFRLVPDMNAKEVVAAVRRHLDKRGYRDLEVRVLSAYDPSTTSLRSLPVRALRTTYERTGIDPLIWPRMAGSWPGYLFTGKPLGLGTASVGLGHGGGAHSKDEYLVVEPAAGKAFLGLDGAVRSFVDFLYTYATL